MSLIKWQKREITTAVCSLVLVIINSILFYLVWEKYYAPFYYSRFYSIGRYAAVAVCFGLYIFLGRLYGAFWVKVSRISEIIYANIVTNIITGGLMYLVAWVFIRHLPNIFPMLFVIGAWTIAACLWIRPAIAVMNHYCAVERMVIIYDSSANYHNGRDVLSRVTWRFQVVGEIYADKNVPAVMEKLKILHAEAVLLCDVSPMIKKEMIKQCVLGNIATYVQPDAGEYLINSARSVQIANLPFLFCQGVYDFNLYAFLKRFFDLILSITGIVVCSPLMLMAAASIKMKDYESVIIKEQRLTINKEVFELYKFRSTGFTSRFRINELPKLFNVLRGELAVVGPRAEKPEEAKKYEETIPEYALKYHVKPGLTGYVQIYGRYSANPKTRLQMDLMYIGQQSLAWDMKMIFATIKVIFLPEGMDLVLDGRVFTEEKRNRCGQTET